MSTSTVDFFMKEQEVGDNMAIIVENEIRNQKDWKEILSVL